MDPVDKVSRSLLSWPGWGLIAARDRYEEGLREALHKVEAYIGNLNTQMKYLLKEFSQVPNRRGARQDIIRDQTQPYNDFVQFFNTLDAKGKKNIRSLALEKFLEHLNQWRDPLPDLASVGDSENPGDGLLYKAEHVNWASKLLRDLHQAWTNMDDISLYPPPSKLVKMGKICLILTGMNQQKLLEDFLDHEVCDEDLHLSEDKIQKTLKEENRPFVVLFLAEQYRAKQRGWYDGDHAKLVDHEPLPLKHLQEYHNGSYGAVTKVREHSTGRLYALKRQLIGSQTSENKRAREHLERERARLIGLKHEHVVRLVKSYERAGSFGLVLEPAAATDLSRLMVRFHENKVNPMKGCRDQELLRPVFMNAFGCLSRGLAYIHANDIRHKDIKPANILYENARGQNGDARLLWGDFGLAYDFSASGNSKTYSTSLYSKRYAAPENLSTSINPSRYLRVVSLDRVVEHETGSRTVEADEPGEKIMSLYMEDEETSHGLKTDIFSLGCVFLEILAAMVREKLPMDGIEGMAIYRNNANEVGLSGRDQIAQAPIAGDENMFCQNIPLLKNWAQKHSAQCQQSPDNGLAPLALFSTSQPK